MPTARRTTLRSGRQRCPAARTGRPIAAQIAVASRRPGPWCAIFLVDAGLRRGRYDGPALLGGRGSRYFRDPAGADGAGRPRSGGRWRRGGFHWPAIIAQAAGMAAAALWLNAAPPYVGPLASRTGAPAGSDFSVFLGLAVAGLTYWLLARRSVPAEAAASPAPPPPPGDHDRAGAETARIGHDHASKAGREPAAPGAGRDHEGQAA